MRVTNSMISNSARQHISTAKNKLLTAEEQYVTQKKIQRPSDDPTVASRSLKFRTTVAQIKQYVTKNVEDALDWMDTTGAAMKNVSSLMTDMKGVLNEGANGPLEADQRFSVLAQARQCANAIFENEANSDYAGRYLFTGYRTDTSLLFPSNIDTLEYKITQKFEASDISAVRYVSSNIAFTDGADEAEYAAMETKVNEYYRVQLAYKNCSPDAITNPDADPDDPDADPDDPDAAFTMALKWKGMTDGEGDVTVETITQEAFDNLDPETITDEKAYYIYDSGEVAFSKKLYEKIQSKDAEITIDYTKKEFNKNDIRPEMYFPCTSYDQVSMKTINYADPTGQEIAYEVNTRQSINVNTQAKDAFSTDIYRVLDYIERTIQGVKDAENRIADAEKRIANTPADDEETLAALKQLKASLEDEKELRVSVMNSAFGMGLTMVDDTSQVLDVAVADMGAKYNRTELTYNKLLDNKVIAEEQLSNNEELDISDAIINLTQADNLYQASLSATAKILGNSLLNYI